MKGIVQFILLAGVVVSLLASIFCVTATSFADQENSIGNVLQAWIPSTWVQTTQALDMPWTLQGLVTWWTADRPVRGDFFRIVTGASGALSEFCSKSGW